MLFTLILYLTLVTTARADLAVVVNKDTPLAEVSIKEVAAIFMGRTTRLQGVPLKPVDIASDKETKKRFYWQITKKTPIQMKAYWSRLLFSGRGSPPIALRNKGDLLAVLGREMDYISYIDSDDVTDDVKVVLLLRED